MSFDTSEAVPEAVLAYQAKLSDLDTYVKITEIAYTVLGRLVKGANAGELVAALYRTTDQNWTVPKRVHEAEEQLAAARRRTVALAVGSVQGEFESAVRNIVADTFEFWETDFPVPLGLGMPGLRAHALAKRGWSGLVNDHMRGNIAEDGFIGFAGDMLGVKLPKAVADLVPLFEYFRRARNRIVHQSGIAGRDFEEYSTSKEFKTALKSFAASVRKKASGKVVLPSVAAGNEIVLGPRDVILFSVITQRLVAGFYDALQPMLQAGGYIRMAAHYSIGAETHEFRDPRHLEPPAAVRRFLIQRYGVKVNHAHDVNRECQELGLIPDIKKLFPKRYPAEPDASVKRDGT